MKSSFTLLVWITSTAATAPCRSDSILQCFHLNLQRVYSLLLISNMVSFFLCFTSSSVCGLVLTLTLCFIQFDDVRGFLCAPENDDLQFLTAETSTATKTAKNFCRMLFSETAMQFLITPRPQRQGDNSPLKFSVEESSFLFFPVTQGLIESCSGDSLAADPNVRMITLYDNEEVSEMKSS